MSLDFDSLQSPGWISEPVRFEGKSYTLKEASGRAAVEYRNAVSACLQYGPDGRIAGVRNIASVEPLLISLCLFDEKGKNVPKHVIESWPSRVQRAIFDRAKQISDLGEEMSAERKLLEEVLNQEGSPISFDELRGYVNSRTPVSKYDPLIRWFRPDEKELSKNEPVDTTDGSN